MQNLKFYFNTDETEIMPIFSLALLMILGFNVVLFLNCISLILHYFLYVIRSIVKM